MMLAIDIPINTVIHHNGRQWAVGGEAFRDEGRVWLAAMDGRGMFLTREGQYLQVVRAPPTWMP